MGVVRAASRLIVYQRVTTGTAILEIIRCADFASNHP